MKVYYECGPCFLRQAKEALDLATDDEDLKIKIIGEIFAFLANNYSKDASSNGTGSAIHNLIKERTNCSDPYSNEKKIGNDIAFKFLPLAKKVIENEETLENYVKIAIIGNILDFGSYGLDTNIEKLISEGFNKKLAINDIDKLEGDLKKYSKLLYLVDNTGEIVFDKLLLEKIKTYGIDITIAVKENPILNDACIEDALDVGLDEFGKIVTIGTGTVGIVYNELSKEFKEIFNSHEFIISKGLGNYEGLTEVNLENKTVYFLLCAKCSAIAKNLGVKLQDMVLLKNRN